MTTERDFDRLARAWLELSPNEAPDRTRSTAVLHAIDPCRRCGGRSSGAPGGIPA